MIKIEITADSADDAVTQLSGLLASLLKAGQHTSPAPVVEDRTEAVTGETVAEPRKPRERRAPKVIDATANAPETEAAAPKSDEPTDEDVREILNKLRKEKGNEALGKVVTQFAPRFSEIPKSNFAQLYAVAKRALAA